MLFLMGKPGYTGRLTRRKPVNIAIRTSACVAALCCAMPRMAWSDPVFAVLHDFTGKADGGGAFGSLVRDGAGNLYGATEDGGTVASNGVVFELSPPAAGKMKWNEMVIYRFKGNQDGASPIAGLVIDPTGALYGTTLLGGGGAGTVFKLTPPAAGKSAWTETVLHRFSGADGTNPAATLLLDPAGHLFGTTCGCYGSSQSQGTVFELAPPASGKGAWSFGVVYTFLGGADGSHPRGPLARDAAGNLYSTTQAGGTKTWGFGTVFRLAPPAPGASTWTKKVLYSFAGHGDGAYPGGGVLLDAGGVLYGTTQSAGAKFYPNGAGTVFALTPPAAGKAAWIFSTLYAFTGGTDGGTPSSTLVTDATGALYGTAAFGGDVTGCAPPGDQAQGCGVLFKLVPPAAGGTKWTQSVLHTFTGPDGMEEQAAPIDVQGTLYGTAAQGGDRFGGTVYSLAP